MDLRTRLVGAIRPSAPFRSLLAGALQRTTNAACVVLEPEPPPDQEDWSALVEMEGSPLLPHPIHIRAAAAGPTRLEKWCISDQRCLNP